MAVELVKDLLKIDETVGKNQIQALVEGKISVPEIKPTINKLLNIDGNTEITQIKVVKGKLVVSGIVNLKVLYNANDEVQSIHSLESQTDFSEEIEIQGADEKMLADVRATIEHIDHSIADENNVSVKVVLLIEGKVETKNNIGIVKEITGTKGLQILKESIMYNNIIGAENSSTIVKETVELEEEMPEIVDVLRVDTKVYERETKVVEDKVIIAGVVEASIMYYGDDEENRINHLSKEIPFTHFVEIPGAIKDMNYNVRMEASNPNFEVKEDIDNSLRKIDLESIVKIHAKVYEQKEKEVTVDTYSTDKKLKVQKQEVNVTENIGASSIKEEIKGVINVSEQNEIIKNIYNVNAKPILTDYRIIESKVIVEGLIEINMLYLGEDSGEIKDISQEVPFKSYVDIEGIKDDMDSEVELILDDIYFNKSSSREVEVNVTIKNQVLVNKIKKINIVTEAEELVDSLDKKSQPSIVVYVVQQNDTLWDIAKKYNTKVDELIELNEIVSPENIMPGEKIIIQKNIEFNIPKKA